MIICLSYFLRVLWWTISLSETLYQSLFQNNNNKKTVKYKHCNNDDTVGGGQYKLRTLEEGQRGAKTTVLDSQKL